MFFFFLVNIFLFFFFFFFQAEDGIRDLTVTGVQTCALPILRRPREARRHRRAAAPSGQRAGGRRSEADRWATAPGHPTAAPSVRGSRRTRHGARGPPLAAATKSRWAGRRRRRPGVVATSQAPRRRTPRHAAARTPCRPAPAADPRSASSIRSIGRT